ncbi:ATP-dependent DNA helicase recQ [Dendryphion nanum]|uniref:ATP-dependent DNA helicase n=1 Tax=Dendryphion nanum TaxID=256645 RepID=A0A9P9DUB2_9PLEO|nr:ATP-dependent DNA helicase recQ [Dendryphion nanum]
MPPKRKRHYDLDFTLRRVFGKRSFRPLQREVITATLEGEDVYLQAATSFGKSLCYQLPAIVDYGSKCILCSKFRPSSWYIPPLRYWLKVTFTIVISPLLALMNNQVAALKKAHIRVETINSTTTPSAKKSIIEDLQCGHPRIRLLYVTPEYCEGDYFRRILTIIHQHQELARIAIDEAHCISEWGHDFRPSFKSLSFFKEKFPDVPMICLTATATSHVRTDIIKMLNLDESKLRTFSMSTSRPNIHYEIRFKSEDLDAQYKNFLKFLGEIYARRATPEREAQLKEKGERVNGVSGIIYTLLRKDCEKLAQQLRADGIGAKPYHAGLPHTERADALAGWVDSREGYDIIVATTAFGMGIDKDNVRFVVHWQIPKSFEGYYQEAGRAGRDGKSSRCILYYAREDRERAITMMSLDRQRVPSKGASVESLQRQLEMRGKSFQKLVNYCESTRACRHKMISEYFGDVEKPVCDYACDWCKDPVELVKRKEKGLASEEWCSTQREMGRYQMDEYE